MVSKKPMYVQEVPQAKWVEKVNGRGKACSSLKGKISDTEVIEDFESRPHKAVTFDVHRVKGYRGGRLPGRSTEEKGR